MNLLIIANRLRELSVAPELEVLALEASALAEWVATKMMAPAERANYIEGKTQC